MPQPRICFGYETAMKILRAGRSGTLGPSSALRLPDHPPSTAELKLALARLEASRPDLELGRPVHVVARSVSDRRKTGTVVPHGCCMDMPSSSFLRWDDDVMLCAPPLALLQVAQCEPNDGALLELGWELCGSYQTKRTAARTAYDVPPLTSTRALRDYTKRNPSLRGARKIARNVLPYLADGSASARETKAALVFGMPMKRGGHGLCIPRMNYEVMANAAARTISGRRSFRCDLCWPEAKLDVEYQSSEHHEGEVSRIRDSRRANALAAMGWTVIGITNDELDSLAATDVIAEAIRHHLGKRKQMRVTDHHARKLRLRRQLGLPVGYE